MHRPQLTFGKCGRCLIPEGDSTPCAAPDRDRALAHPLVQLCAIGLSSRTNSPSYRQRRRTRGGCIMATTPVPVQKPTPSRGSASTPDVFRSLRSEMDRLFERFASGVGLGSLPGFRFDAGIGVPSPAVDITEDDTAFKVTAELPGMTDKDVEVALRGDTLT